MNAAFWQDADNTDERLIVDIDDLGGAVGRIGFSFSRSSTVQMMTATSGETLCAM